MLRTWLPFGGASIPMKFLLALLVTVWLRLLTLQCAILIVTFRVPVLLLESLMWVILGLAKAI